MIRFANEHDIDAICELGQRMHAETNFRTLRFDGAIFGRFLRAMISMDKGVVLLAEDHNRIVGMYIGMVTPTFFSQDRVATDVLMYVSPEERRGQVGRKLLEAFEAWAESKEAVQIRPGISIGGNIEAPAWLYRSAGYETAGYTFVKNI